MANFDVARTNMIEGQIRPNKVIDPRLIEALSTLPRELFVPADKRGVAYCDEDIDIGNGRFLMEPMVLARLIQEAAIEHTDMVLDIGCATGYSTALLAGLANTVVAIEDDDALVERATETLNSLDILNAAVMKSPLADGYAEQAPYDVIMINGCIPEIPEKLTEQLAENGRIVCVLEREGTLAGHMGQAVMATRVCGTVSTRPLFDAATWPLKGFEKDPGFTF